MQTKQFNNKNCCFAGNLIEFLFYKAVIKRHASSNLTILADLQDSGVRSVAKIILNKHFFLTLFILETS